MLQLYLLQMYVANSDYVDIESFNVLVMCVDGQLPSHLKSTFRHEKSVQNQKNIIILGEFKLQTNGTR